MSFLKNIFGKRLPNSDKVLTQAIQILRQGDAIQALTIMKQCLDTIREQAGEKSLEHAEALYHYGTLLGASGDLVSGSQYCQLAADACPASKEGAKARLTYLMNVGQLLARAGKGEEAIPVLKSSLTERIAFYGTGHAGVAYGQQVLAEAMLSAGQYAEGFKLAEEATQLFLKERHHEFPSSFALRAALACATGKNEKQCWEGLADLPEEVIRLVVSHVYEMAPMMNGQLGLNFMRSFTQWCDHYLPDSQQLRLNSLITWSNLASERDAKEEMGEVADRLNAFLPLLKEASTCIQLTQGIALSYSRCGRPPQDVRQAYQQAEKLATNIKDPLSIAGNARNWALYEAEQNNGEEACRLFDEAIDQSRMAGTEGKQQLGRSLIAKGIYLQHHHQPKAALPLLKEGVDLLPPTDSDGSCGTLHLVALENGLACPCNGSDEVGKQGILLLARKFFDQSGLGTLIESVDFEEKGLAVRLARKPKDDEMQRLQIVHSVFVNQLGATSRAK